MVRIQVIKASRLALAGALIVLAIVLTILALQGAETEEEQGAFAGEEAAAVFANLSSMPLAPGATRDSETDGVRVEVVTQPPVTQPQIHPRVLIYHTHTCEAYRQVEEDPYQETERWRTADPAHSVVRVGEALAALLQQAGCEVTHDTTDHELPDLRTAYTRSLQTLQEYEARGERFDLYIDLHRNAYSEGTPACAVVNGQEVAGLMLMVGRGEGYQDKPDFEENYAFAARVTACINARADGLCQEVLVREGRYNQHVGTPSILVEAGHNQNTLEQALSSMPYLADGLMQALAERMEAG